MKITKKLPIWVAQAYEQYSFGKQSLRQLAGIYHRDIKTLRKYFDAHTPYTGEVIPVPEQALSVVFDVTFFKRTSGMLVFRASGKTLYWREVITESREIVATALDNLDVITAKNYASFTIDGKPGMLQLLEERYPHVPVQLCLFHQQQIITRYITKHPKTVCGRAMKHLMITLTATTQQCFQKRLVLFEALYGAYLKERNERNQYKHRRLRSALRSLKRNLPHLFTYQRYPEQHVPTTTNSCDGSFAHWKQKVGLHRGLRKHRRNKMFNTFLSASQISH